MTYRAVRQLLRGINLVGLPQLFAQRMLIRRRWSMHGEDLIARPEVRCRIAMALEARIHRPGSRRHHYRELVHLAVARDAADTLVDMDAVIEVNVVWKVVDARPLNRTALLKTFADKFEARV